MPRCRSCRSEDVSFIGPTHEGEAVIMACRSPGCGATFVEDLSEILDIVRRHQRVFPTAEQSTPVFNLVPAGDDEQFPFPDRAFRGWRPPDRAA